VRTAVARERALARASRSGDVVHRLPPSELRGGRLRNRVRAWLLSGALVESGPGAGTGRILDVAAADAGITDPVDSVRRPAAGGVLAFVRRPDGTRAVLRVARAGWLGDPRPGFEALRDLDDQPFVPKALASGEIAGAAWTLETALPGSRPRRLDRATAEAVSRAAANLRRSSERPASIERDLSRAASALPERAARLRAAAERAGTLALDVRGIMRHGDLWLGNLLVRESKLSGVVDWDAWDREGVPGADVLHLYGTDLALSSRRELGEVWLTEPWRSEGFSAFSAPYWSAVGIAPGDELLLLAGIAWWAAAIAGTLGRAPERASDARWVAMNVDRVAERITRG
jgi:hypothetical protein